MASTFTLQRRVEFAETDMAGILHFANYFRYMEEVEHAFFRSLGMSVHPHSADSGVFGWARGRAECTYERPLRYEDVVDLCLTVREKRSRSIVYEVVFRCRGTVVARGSMVAICIAKEGDELRAVRMPDEVDALIEPA